MSAETFVKEARALLGTRWRHRGRKSWAVDCIGLIVLAAKRAGMDLEDEPTYGREPWDDQLRKGLQRRFGDPVSGFQIGDVVLIRWRKEEPSHVAIVADHPYGFSLIHAHNLQGVVECGLSGPYLNCIEAIYRPTWPVKYSP